MATATLTYVTGVNAATNYVRVGHNSSAVNNDAVWSFSLSEAGTNKFTSVSFSLTWNNTSAGTGWSGNYTYVFAVSSSGTAGRTAQSGTVLARTTKALSGASGTATFTISGLSLTPGTTYYLRGNFNGTTHSTMKAFAKANNKITGTTRSLITYTISYKKGSNGSGTETTATKTYGTALTLKGATFTRTGYHQTGWATSDGGSQAYALSASYTANAAATLYPVWTSYKANVTYNVNGGTITTGTGTTRYRVSGSTVQVSSNSGSTWSNLTYSFGIDTTYPNHWNVATYGATRTGYYITGTEAYGTTSSGGILINQDYGSSSTTNAATVYRMNGNANLTADKNFTLYIHWKPNTYTITFNRNGGPPNGSSSATATYNAAMPSATMPTRAGYTFEGYYDAASGGTQYYTSTGTSARAWNKTSNTTLYAHWTKNSYNLTLNCTSGSYQILPYDRDISNWSNFRLNENQWLAQHKDGYFASGVNGITHYVNNSSSGNGTSTVTRVSKQSDNPLTGSNYELEVSVSKNANTAYIGFVQTTTSAASQVFIHLFVAKLPKNYYFSYASNATGDGRSFRWLTPWEGTGKYEVYAIELHCGSSGTFSTFGHIYVQPNNTAFTLDFYVAYSEIFNVTQSQVFSVPYNTVTSSLPIPVRPGYKFVGWGRSFNGSQQGMFGRDMYYTDKICIHFKAYMDNWQLYGSTPMRMISCTEGGGWNIEPSTSGDSYQFNFLFYDAGASAYKSTLSNTLMSDLTPGWHTFDMIFDGTNVKGYIDGVLEGTSANFSGAIGYNSTNGLFVGCESVSTETTGGSPYFTGHMTSPLIWHGTSIQGENNTQITMPAGSWSLTSYWESEAQSSTLTLDPDGGTISSTSVTNSIGSLTTLPTPTKAGYKFKGWYYKLDGHRYAALPRNLMFDSALSIHLDAYLDDWSQIINGTPLISCTETGGWNLYPSGDHMMSSLYDSGTNSYKDVIDSNHLVSDLSPGWHSFDLVYEETWDLYIDDTLIASSASLSGDIGYNNYNSILIGAEPVGYALDFDYNVQFFKGKIGNIRIIESNQKISNLDISQAHMPAVDATLVAIWEESSNYIKLYTSSGWQDIELQTYTSNTTYMPSTFSGNNIYNTVWKINTTPDWLDFWDNVIGDTSASIQFVWFYNNQMYYSIETDYSSEITWGSSTSVYNLSNDEWNNISDDSYRIIKIMGGSDANYSEVIDWFKDNATYLETQTTSSFSNFPVKVYTLNGWQTVQS